MKPHVAGWGAWRRALRIGLGMGWACALTLASTLVAAKATIKDLDPTGPQPQVVLTDGGKPEPLYKASHALLISAANYQGVSKGGWEPLPATAREMDDLASALRNHGFSVRRVSDPEGFELRDEIRDFVALRGQDPRNRVLIFFSGHGHTDEDTQKGYIVPVDAPDPYRSRREFIRKAMPIEELNIIASELRARHALFLFDSCFSGSVFQTRSNERVPNDRRQYLRGVAEEPVRQMIAAGRANEKLPGRSIFTPLLIDLLRGKRQAADDEYLTGRDIGRWLMQNLPSANPNQHPHSGYVPGRWDLGDMVFQLRPVAPQRVVPAPLSRFRDCDDDSCPWLRVLPAGRFTMGSPDGEAGRDKDEGPQHEVTISKPFAVMETEVTVGMFKAFVKDPGHKTDGGCWIWDGKEVKSDPATTWRKPFAALNHADNHPVVCVNWDDAQAFARWMTKRTGQSYRLLSEAEWEYAARSGSSAAYSFGADPYQVCRHGNVADRRLKAEVPGVSSGATVAECDDGYAYTAPVGSFQPNAFGLYDMHGNAWEWVQDCQNDYQAGGRTEVAVEGTNCARRLLRGGGWVNVPGYARSAVRIHGEPTFRGDIFGFRLARMLP